MNKIKDVREYVEECTMCHFYYVEHHMSLRDTSRETLLSKDTVLRRLESLKEFNEDMYSEYIAERRKRHAGRKPRYH